MGANNYPNSLEEAMNIMNNHQQSERYSNKSSMNTSQPREMNFGQKGSSGKNGHQNLSNITCYHCGEKGHYANSCPKKKSENEQVHTNINEGWKFDDDNGVEYNYH